jgi:activator of HSP90 ATPase
MNSTRRQAISAIAATLAAAPITGLSAQQPTSAEKAAHESLTAIHYQIDFAASPQRLYQAIIDQKQFTAFSGLPATIDPIPGGAFSLFGGLIAGRNIELVPDSRANPRIVQAWRPASWDPGIYSLVRFEFTPRAAETTLIFDHTSFPIGDYDHLDWGWHTHYWDPLMNYLSS